MEEYNFDKLYLASFYEIKIQEASQWTNTIKNEKVEVTAKDGITLRGIEYIKDKQIDDWVIVLHGYRQNPESVISVGMHFSEKGYNVLIPYMRATGEIEGEYIGMGWLDKEDLKCWIDLIIEQNRNSNIILHGSPMGAATVLMASGDTLPNNIKAIINVYFIHAEVDTKATNIDNLSSLGKLLSNNFVPTQQKNNLKAIQYFFMYTKK